MTYTNLIDVQIAAQLGANAAQVPVYIERTLTGRWEVTTQKPLETTNKFRVYKPNKG